MYNSNISLNHCFTLLLKRLKLYIGTKRTKCRYILLLLVIMFVLIFISHYIILYLCYYAFIIEVFNN